MLHVIDGSTSHGRCPEPAPLSDRYEIVTIDLGDTKDEGTLAKALRDASAWLASKGLDGKAHDYLGDSGVDRVLRYQRVYRLVGGLLVRLRPIWLLQSCNRRTIPASFDRLAILSKPFRRLVEAVAGSVARLDISLVLVDECAAFGAQVCALCAGVKACVPVAIHSRREPARMRRRLVHEVEPRARSNRHVRLSRRLGSISNLYGTRAILSEYCDIPEAAVRIPGFWMHGWIPRYHNVHPSFIALHKTVRSGFVLPWARKDAFDKASVQLVVRRDQADYLKRSGYTRVRAIGHPLTYMKRPEITRVRDSLLVMPPHSFPLQSDDDSLVRDYVLAIADVAKQFSTVRLCVATTDYIQKAWWVAFERAGIDHVVGVDSADPRASYKLANMISQFEYVTTNGYGSHIAYAAWFGCKVSIYGPFATPPVKMMRHAHAVVHFPELLDLQLELCGERELRRNYPELFVEPACAIQRRDWAEQELGLACRLDASGMRSMLTGGWSAL